MTAPPLVAAVIAELQSLGVEASPGEDRAPLIARLQARIIRLVSSEPAAFDRDVYTRLMAVWTALHPETEGSDEVG